uniref:Predicted protein n=1 Tax=Physcomitrium patens TaxID=3218 RepID=A9U3N2_PHYPA
MGIFPNIGPELVGRLNVVPITGSILFQAVLFSVPFQGTLFTVNASLKDSQWIQDRKYKGVLKINSLGCSGFSVTSRDLSAGAKKKRLRQAIFQQSKTDRLLDYRRISILPSTARRPARSRAGKHQQQSNDRKEALATKALQAVVNKIDQFDGRNISRYLRCYVREMELNRVSEKKMVALFGLATIPEIRDHITSITDHCGNSWEDFSHALKDEYFLEDADRVTKKLFLGWIERPNKNLQATELLREFERQYSQLSKQHFFVQDTTSYPLILGQPYITATRMETKVLDDGSAYARRDYGGTKEEVLLRDEGAFDASFIGILENGNILYKKVDDFKRKERKRLYDIEGQLRKIENGLEDSLELITSIGLGDNDKFIEIHSREVYTMLESFQAPEVTVETRYKTADKKVKPVAGPLPEDSKE